MIVFNLRLTANFLNMLICFSLCYPSHFFSPPFLRDIQQVLCNACYAIISFMEDAFFLQDVGKTMSKTNLGILGYM